MSVDTVFAAYGTDTYLYQFGDTGIVLNTEATASSPFVDVVDVVGLDSAPIRSSERDYNGMDGGFVSAEYENVRSIIIEGVVYGNDPAALELFLDDLKENYAPSSTVKPFYIKSPGIGTRVIYCKSLGVKYDVNRARRTGSCEVLITLRAENPAFLGAELSSSVELPGGGVVPGRGYDKSFDYGYGSTGATGGILTVNVASNRPTPGKFRIHGPVENPTILNENTGQLMYFGISLPALQFLEVDLRYKTVRLNGETNRRNVLRGTNVWFLLQKGLNTFRFGGIQPVPGPPNATLELIYRPAYR